MRLFAVSRRAIFACATLGLLCLVGIQGCSDDDDENNPVDPGGSSTQLTGTFVGATDGGKMAVSIPLASTALAPRLRLAGSARAHEVIATGTLNPLSGGSIPLNGTYDEEANLLHLEGGTGLTPYVFDGTYDNTGSIPGIAGTYTGPDGDGGFGCAVGGSGTVTVYCGTYTNGIDTGNLHLIVVGTHVEGAAILADGVEDFEGTISGTAPDQTITVDKDLENGTYLHATADLNGTTITNGTWTIGPLEGEPLDSGTWEGSTSCSNPTN